MSTYEANVERSGLSESHALLLGAVPAGARVLDVGCATGYLAARLRERGCVVTGIEADPAAAATAQARGIDAHVADLEDSLAREAVRGPFDAVILGDVLEHLRDPADVLAWAAGITRAGGIVAISLPNAVHWNARREIARGRFPQTEFGTFDRTHLRWFTRARARALAADAGLLIDREAFTTAPLPGEPLLRRLIGGTDSAPPGWLAALRRALADRRPELFALQFVLVCRRP